MSGREERRRGEQLGERSRAREGTLDRRSALGLLGGVVGTMTLGAVGSACTFETGSSERAQGGSAPSSTPGADFEWLEADLDSVQRAMAGGGLSSVGLTEAYLDRIAAMDRTGPSLHSVIETNPEALEIAAVLDRERKEGKVRGPLHGIPMLVKDNIGTADKMTTTAGSLALEGSIAPRDAFVSAQLRRAGAVLLGKANLSEWANIRSSNSSSGWSARGGQCRNPYALDRNPCGSSSGSGVAVSANLCMAAIGTETNGSIVCPSSANGVVGIKPTLGLVSRSAIIPIAHSQDTAGPMARTVRDAAHVLSALIGSDPSDPVTAAAKDHGGEYSRFLTGESLAGKRLGVVRSSAGFDARVDALLEDALDALRTRGAEIVDVEFERTAGFTEASRFVLSCELKSDLALYFAGLGPRAPVKTLADVIAFNQAHAAQEMPYFGQEIFLLAEATGGVLDPDYEAALAKIKRVTGPEGIDQVMAKHRLDGLVAPTGGPAWVTDLVNGDHFSGGSSTFAAVAGYPNITVPMGFVHGLPVGLSFFGRAFSEPVLLEVAFAFEQETNHRAAPRFLPSATLA